MKGRFLFAACAALTTLSTAAKIRMGAPFADGAVLQRGRAVPVWGKVAPSDGALRRVKVTLAGQTKIAETGTNGEWKVLLDPLDASKESRTMTVVELQDGGNSESVADSIEIKDILVGEVWFASGQSNMECPIWGSSTRYRDMKGGFMTTMTRLPNIRYVKCFRTWSVEPKEISAIWRRFVPEDLQRFNRVNTGVGGRKSEDISLSAMAFYYARELYLALDVPIGIVDASWGGSNIDAWTPRCGYDDCDEAIRNTAEYQVKTAGVDKRYPITERRQQPTVIYNGMVAAFAPMAMRGLIWSQGCHNWKEPELYRAKLHALYNGWCREFNNPDLSFYLVQPSPYTHNWLGICMAQTGFCSEQKNAALAVTADAGNFYDIHPNDKEIVAKRLALHALKRDYGFDIPEDDSPVVRSVICKDGKAIVSFDNVKEWYVYAKDHSRNPAFELAGEDDEWHSAKIENFRKKINRKGAEVDTDFIDGPDIFLSCEAVPLPVKVRYMGKPRTSGTLYNEAALPLGPFEAAVRIGGK